ncbi:MAG TPA: SAM-dependent chlorinase/fluorinase, partial [Solirubrobacterales bacterium]|nr:SAM-dependent chlorinase/fluorinase [Solirubrobacterales bacterium]
MADALPITFLSDYGEEDEFAGVCRAVITQIAPDAPLVDLTHGVGRQGIRQGALALANALPFCPPGVHLAVVDPGVGTARRPVAVTTMQEGRFLVGPDNGLLWPAIERFGGAARAIDLSRSPFRLEPVSATFHGRDLFAPVAAHLAIGARLDEAGEKFEPAELTRLELPQPVVEGGRAVAHALYVDRFGNVTLDLDAEGARAASL